MKVAIFFCLLAFVAAEFHVTKIDPCDPPPQDGNAPAANACEIHEVRIDPCRKNKRCILTKGEKAVMNFDFTPNFSSSTLKAMAYWPGPGGDVAFDGMGGDDGCAYTPCPVESGKKQTFNYDLHLGTKLPTGIFVFKWKVWNPENALQDVCCFKTTIQLKRPVK